jgi:two-component system, chemotaxis family, sensor kinase CheA
MDMDKYRGIFIRESENYLRELDADLIRVESDLLNRDLWGRIHGRIHSVKGMARALSLDAVSDLCHLMEAWCKAFQTGTVAPNRAAVHILTDGSELLNQLVAATVEGVSVERGPDTERIRALLAQRPDKLRGDTREGGLAVSCPSAINRINVEYSLIEELLARSQEIILLEKTLPPLTHEQISSGLRSWIDRYMAMLRGLHFQLTRLRLMPVRDFVSLFEKTVRDLARTHDREVRLEVAGEELEVDIGLMDRLREPLMHLLRNAVAHGIEPPHEREGAGKERQGKITLEAKKHNDHLVLRISDDGRGIDPGAITRYLQTAMNLSHGEIMALPREEFLGTIFRTDFSSARETTQLAGRGIGMDVIARAVHYLNGSIAVQSQPLEGTTFTLTLPLSLAIVYGIVFRIGAYTLAVPTSHVAAIEEITEDPPRGPGDLFDMGARLEIDPDARRPTRILKLRAPQTAAFLPSRFAVDAVVGNIPLMVMPPGELLARTGSFAGVGIMENGDLSILLDMEKVGRDNRELRD